MKLSYQIRGDGPPLALVHGMGVSFSIWSNLAPLLSEHFRLIMIELPGIGSSPAPDPATPYYEFAARALDELRQDLGYEAWSLLSYSLGTRAGDLYVRLFAERTVKAIFLCPVYFRIGQVLALRSLMLIDTRRPAFGDWILSGWRLYWLVRALGFNLRPHPYAALWTREISSQVPGYVKASLYGLPQAGHSAYEATGVPTLFIWGRQDLLSIAPFRPRSNDVVIHADHSAPMNAAPAVAKVILSFLHK